MSSLWNHLVKFQYIFNLTYFHHSRPSNKIYVAYFMYPAFLFRPRIFCLTFPGLTWIFGFLAIDGARVIFHYVFAILNAFQGFFIFLLFTAREKQVSYGHLVILAFELATCYRFLDIYR